MLENLELIGTGFAVVMTVLASIWGACALVGSFFIRAEKAAAAAKAVAAPVAAPALAPAASTSGVPAHHVAAIAAAVASTLGAGYRVTRVAVPPLAVGDWPLEGRFQSLTANRVRTEWGPTRVSSGGQHTK